MILGATFSSAADGIFLASLLFLVVSEILLRP